MSRFDTVKQEKIQLVDQLNNVLIKGILELKSIHYDILGNGSYEFLVVEFSRGAKYVRNCTGTSFSYIVSKELPKLLEGDYPDEVEWYESMKAQESVYEN